MIDSFVLLAPLLLLPVVALFSFVGCFIEPSPPIPALKPKLRINCGGPAVPDTDLAWQADTIATGGASGTNQTGGLVKDDNNADAGPVYETWQNGPAFSYPDLVLGEGDCTVMLKFALLDSAFAGGIFRVILNGTAITINAQSIGLARKFDHSEQVHVDSSGKLTIVFEEDQPAHGAIPFINAIEIDTYQ